MKKGIVLLFVVIMLFSCTACGSFMESFQEGFEEGFNAALQNASDEANKEVTRGVVSGNVYTSDYSGLTFTKPDGWVYSTDEEIAEMMDISVETLTEADQYEAAIAGMLSIYDMMVIDNSTGNNIIVMYENLETTNNSNMTVDDYLASLKQQLSAASTAYQVQDTIRTVSLSGKTYQCMTTTVSNSGIEMQQLYYVRKMDSFMQAIIVTIVDDTSAAEIEAMFS